MELSSYSFLIKKPPFLFFTKPLKAKPFTKPIIFFSYPNSAESHTSELALSLQNQTLNALEWSSLCNHLSSFTSTSMGRSVTQAAAIPIGNTLQESQYLLSQTAAALAVLESGPVDFSGIEDITGILNSAVSGELLTVRELCGVWRTLRAAKALFDRLKSGGDHSKRFSPLLEILQSWNLQIELEQKIGFCIDCNLSIILDRASDELALIRYERKKNMENLDTLLKGISARIFQAGGIDKPLITKRRSRFCVGVRASHKYLISDGVVLDISGSGATYFMEPGEAVELNNLDIMLSNSEKAEERAILSMLTCEIAESEKDIKYLLNIILEIDLAFARATYSQRMKGVCPILTSGDCEGASLNGSEYALSIDIEGIRHPLLIGSSKRSLMSNFLGTNSENSSALVQANGMMDTGSFPEGLSEFPVPINIKVKCGTRAVVISGPNTGGKTASMKTLGVASLMSKAGLYLPAQNTPRLPWFDLVLADIGDHQSLEQNLSTFSGHISHICKILEVASKESLVLIDEICCGTDPSEGVALSTSMLQYLIDRVNLAVVTTHYADLSRLKDKDTRFENAAMEFSLETLQPTYQILWGSTGNSNALRIAKSIGFDTNIIEGAQKWVEKLMPEKQQERKGLLYQSLIEERSRLEAQASRAASLHKDVMELYSEGEQIHSEFNEDEAASYGPRVQTSKNTVDLRGMRVEEASLHLDMAISGREPNSVIFVVHGMGTGAIKQCALEILGKHPRVAKYEPESPMNFGCTVAYVK